MDAFESIVKTIFESKGYWVKTEFKVNLTKEEKRLIGKPSSPRWELDLVAYKRNPEEVLVVECKSYFDSTGVQLSDLQGGRYRTRYKLFDDENLKSVVFNRLKTQLVESGACSENTSIKLCLACGKIARNTNRADLNNHFESRGWGLYSDNWIKDEIIKLADSGYENNVATVTTKILKR